MNEHSIIDLISFAVIYTITKDPKAVGYNNHNKNNYDTHFGQICRNMLHTYVGDINESDLINVEIHRLSAC